MSLWISSPGFSRSKRRTVSSGSRSRIRFSPSRRRMRLTVAGDTPTSAAICLPVWRWRRNASITAHVAGAVWLGNERGSGGAILQSIHAFCAEPLNPFGHDLGRYVELARGRSLAQAAFGNTAHHRLSTFGRQRRILVAVHLVSPWNTEASQPQLPRFGPDGQPPERPQLEHDGF